MKYKATKQNNGTWFVATNTVKGQKMGFIYATEQEAKENAITLSIGFYEDMKQNAWEELKDLAGGDDYGVRLVGSDHMTNLGDLCC
jgi:hypothetical protein